MTAMQGTPATIDRRVLFSTLWIVVVLNILVADVLAFYIPGAMEEVAEFAGGMPVTQLMLVGAIMNEIAIAMIFLSRILGYQANRWANIVASVIAIAYVVGGGSTYPHYIFLAGVEVLCLLLVIWLAWRWPNPEG